MGWNHMGWQGFMGYHGVIGDSVCRLKIKVNRWRGQVSGDLMGGDKYWLMGYIYPIPLIWNTPIQWSQICVNALVIHGFWLVFTIKGKELVNWEKIILFEEHIY
jgi:hypothetical protein